ncbi:MAG: 2TM domain-containing protein [Bacteroidota bacterium]
MSKYQNHRRGDEHLTIPERKAKFTKHLRTYLVMSVFFVLINLVTSPFHFWAIYPILGWGVGIVMEYTSLYGPLRDKEEELTEEFDINDQPLDPMELREVEQKPLYRDKDLV